MWAAARTATPATSGTLRCARTLSLAPPTAPSTVPTVRAVVAACLTLPACLPASQSRPACLPCLPRPAFCIFADAGTYGINTAGDEMSIKLVVVGQYDTNIGARTYLMADDTHYAQLKLKNRELSFVVDVSGLPCGVNGALYFVDMDADGGASKYPGNKAGAAYGTGCASRSPRAQASAKAAFLRPLLLLLLFCRFGPAVPPRSPPRARASLSLLRRLRRAVPARRQVHQRRGEHHWLGA